MAMQTSMGLSKILILVGAGYTGSLVLKNHSLSEILAELQLLLTGSEKLGDSDATEAVRGLERQLQDILSKARGPVIIPMPGSSSQLGSLSSLAVPAVTLGAAGYVYMWWKGLSLSDLMYVTKSNMANAVSNMTKHLENVSTALSATKRHLTQRIENLDGKLDDQREMSKLIKDEVTDVRADVSQIAFDIDSLRGMISGLDGKICSLEDKQDYANAGVWYLCNLVGAKDEKMGEFLQALPKPSKPRAFLGFAESQNLMGLKQIADTMMSGNVDNSSTNGIKENDIDTRSLRRTSSIRCSD